MVKPFCWLTIILSIQGVSSQKKRKEKPIDLLNDVPNQYSTVPENNESLRGVITQIRTSMASIIEENKIIRRRLNRLIQENTEMSSRIDTLETSKGQSTATAPSIDNDDIKASVDEIRIKCEEQSDMFSNFKLEMSNALVIIQNFQSRSELNERRRTLNLNELTAKIHRRFIVVERRVNTLEESKSSTPSPSSLSSTIETIVSRLPIYQMGRSSERESILTSLPLRELTNMARVMWQLPRTCDELAQRGLDESDSGRYLLRPEEAADPLIVSCDFGSGMTALQFSNGARETGQGFDACVGVSCSNVAVDYLASPTQINALKGEMRYCSQRLAFKCASSSVSDRIIWTGHDNSQNSYFSRSGVYDGCECSMGAGNDCEGGFLCNCDASDNGDSGTITNKEALPIRTISGSNINSTSDIVVTVGPFECWGRPGWTEWNQWSLCSASCQGGEQVRSRECEGRQSKCVGEAVQSRPCNQFACAEWAVWSSWSECIDSITKVPKPCGQKERTRTCQGSGRCEGNAIEYTQCDCVFVLGGNGHKLNASVIDSESKQEEQVDLGTRIRMPALTAHCIVKFKNRFFVIGGWNTRMTVFELRDCGLVPLRLKLPREYRVHSCAVHQERIWVCGSRDDPNTCDSFDEKWNHRKESDTLYPHSYGSMVESARGLAIIGGVSSVSGRNDKVEFNLDGEWEEGPSIPTRLSSHTSHNINGDLYVLGGLISDTGVLGQSDRVFRLGRDAKIWEEVLSLKRSRSHHASVALPNGAIMLIGDPYAIAPVELYTNSSTQLLSVSHEKRAFPAAVHLDRPVC